MQMRRIAFFSFVFKNFRMVCEAIDEILFVMISENEWRFIAHNMKSVFHIEWNERRSLEEPKRSLSKHS